MRLALEEETLCKRKLNKYTKRVTDLDSQLLDVLDSIHDMNITSGMSYSSSGNFSGFVRVCALALLLLFTD